MQLVGTLRYAAFRSPGTLNSKELGPLDISYERSSGGFFSSRATLVLVVVVELHDSHRR